MAYRYIRQGATGANNGSDWTNAWNSPPSALVRGDAYYITGGVYGGLDLTTPLSGTTYIPIKKATTADHGTDTGWSSGYASGQASFNTIYFSTGYWIIDGQTGGGPGSWDTNLGILARFTGSTASNTVQMRSSYDCKFIELRHLEVTTPKNNLQDAIQVSGHDHIISDCYIHDASLRPILLYSSAYNILIDRTYLHDCASYEVGGPHAELMYIGFFVSNFEFRYCKARNPRSTGGLMFTGNSSNVKIHGNCFFADTDYGPTSNNGIIGSQSSIGAGTGYSNIEIYNNSFSNLTYGGSGRIWPQGDGSAVIFRNNLFSNCPSNDTMGGSHDYNWYYNSGGLHGEANAQAGSGVPFIDQSGGNYRLLAATNPGVSVASPMNIDPDGVTRGFDGAWDRGAYEFDSGYIPPPVIPARHDRFMVSKGSMIHKEQRWPTL